VTEVGDADGGGAVHFIGVAGADAALGGADAFFAGGGFAEFVFGFVPGHDDVGFVGDLEIDGRDGDAAAYEFVDFAEENFGVEDDAIADDVEDVFAEDSDGEEMGGVFFTADADGVAGVCAAAIADDDVSVFGEEIDDFPLALVAPLEAYDGGIALEERRSHGNLSQQED
jgi:hypothetical protein